MDNALKLKKVFGIYYPYYRKQLDNGDLHATLRCPHKHKNDDGTTSYETKASCGFDFEKGVYHCFSCHSSGSITNLLQNKLGIGKAEIQKVISAHTYLEDYDYNEHLGLSFMAVPKATELNLYDQQLFQDLKIGSNMDGDIIIPAYVHDNLVDVSSYNNDKQVKLKRMKGSKNGFVIPFDVWKTDIRPTILCAGEKDMLTLRKNGFNAITLTGGELATPLCLRDFDGKPVYICYDNDNAGKKGAVAVAKELMKHCARTYIIDISQVCVQDKEDVWDFFNKYNKTKQDFDRLIKNASQYTEVDVAEETAKKYPKVTLSQALSTHINRFVTGQIQVQAGFGETFTVYTEYTFIDHGNEGVAETIEFTDKDMVNMCELFDNNVTEAKVNETIIKKYLPKSMEFNSEGKPNKQVAVLKHKPKTVYKYLVTDGFGIGSASDPVEISMYFLDCKPDNGQEYTVIYKTFPHPTQGMRHYAIANYISDDGTVLNGFKVNDKVVRALENQKRPVEMSIDEYLHDSFLRMKSHGELHDEQIFTAVELTLHSVLELSIGTKKSIRGTLDVLNIGNSRNGKSTTTKACTDVRDLGKIMSLKSSTIESIVGGSQSVGSNKWVIKPGAVCTNDRKALVFEELSGAREGLIPRLTDIRSSQINRIARVSGTSAIPARCRYYWISNPPRQKDGTYKQVQEYSNGLELIKDLVPAQEDIARYDFFLISPGVGAIDFRAQILESETRTPYSLEDLKMRLLWAWTRKKEDIKLDVETQGYLADRCTALALKYTLPVQIFGNETLDKVLRVAASIATYTVSTNHTYEHVIITKEHIDWAINFLVGLYDNDVFKINTLLGHSAGAKRTITVQGV